MEAAIKGTARLFKETFRLAFSWLKDTNSLALEQEVKVGENKNNIQDNKARIQGNVTEIFSVKANQELHEDKIGCLEEKSRNRRKL